MATLQKLTEHWQFGEGWEDALRDRLVCGIRDEVVRKRLIKGWRRFSRSSLYQSLGQKCPPTITINNPGSLQSNFKKH